MADHEPDIETKVAVAALNCIDLSNSDINQSVALIKQACLDRGTFYIINHGISEKFMDEVFAQSKKFFELPLREQMMCNKSRRGYREIKDYAESLELGVLEDDPTNVWPPAGVLPGWKEIMQRYGREAFDVGRAVARLLALALDLNVDFFNQPEMLGDDTSSFYTLFHYKAEETDLSKGRLAGAAHFDGCIITLLATDDVLGLQICRDENATPQVWEYVQPLKGAFIVNVADTLERLTNGTFRSVLHRVLYRQDRYSVPMFLSPSDDALIECLPNCISEENPPKYPPVKYVDFLFSRYKKFCTDNEDGADASIWEKN